MNVRCPQCQTVFRVDPAKIPPGGARARCARCGAKFSVQRPAAARAGQTATTGAPPAAPPGAPAAPSAPPPQPAPAAAGPTPPAASTGAGASPRPGAPGSPLSRDPHARAERLARALVSDIVAYHPERRDKSLSEGTLRTEFREEIMKSWEEYVAQVGITTAKSTPYFRDALNKILAKGQQVF